MTDPADTADDDPYLSEIIKTLAFGAAFASIPIFASMQNIQPPWPEPVAYISAAIVLVGALVAREFGVRATNATRLRLLMLAAILTVIGLFAYLYLYSSLVMTLENGERRTLGFVCNAATQELYPAECPQLSELALSRAGYDPAGLYTPGSLTAAKMSLVAAWLLFTAGLVAAVGWAVVGRKKRGPSPPPAQPDPPKS